jgi:hypothetical protein
MDANALSGVGHSEITWCRRLSTATNVVSVPLALSFYCHMGRESRHQRRTMVRKLSRRERDTRVTTGNLDPELDFLCPFCNGVYSLFHGRHKLHLQKCKYRVAQNSKVLQRPSLPSPPPFENEVFPTPVVAGESTIQLIIFPLPTHVPRSR